MHWTVTCILLGTSLLGISLQSAQAQPDSDVCIPGPGDSKGHQLPTLPEQYKLEVEAYISNKNYTIESIEHYDDINNRGAITRRSKETGRSSDIFYDYDDAQYYVVYPNNTCVTHELNKDTFSVFGYHTEGGKGHINSAKDVFKFGEAYNETYMGQTTVDYIQANWWSTCVYDQHSNHTYRLDFYFSVDSLQETIPLRVIMNGTEILHRNATTGEPDSRRWFHHIYTFRHVIIGPQADSLFLPPIGVLCTGRVNKKDLPKVPPHFGLTIEVVTPEDKTVHYIKEYYNFAHKKVAYEMIPMKEQEHKAGPTPIREVHDYETGIAYRIVSSGVCHINPIPIGAADARSEDNEHVKLRVSANLFGLHASDVEWIYEGVMVNRDVVLDVWQSKRLHWKPTKYHGNKTVTVNSTWAYSFAVDGWTVDNLSKGTLQDLPMRLEIDWVAHYGNKFKTSGKEIHNFVRLTQGLTENSDMYFDVSDCYSHLNESLHLAFNLAGKDTYTKYVINNTKHFYQGATSSIAKAMGVSSSRVAHLQVVEGFHTLSTLFFTLLDRPQVEGDAINQTDPGPALKTAYAQLQLLVNSKEGSMLTLEFIYHDEITHITAAVDTLREETQPLIEEKQTGLATGPVVGIAIGSFVFGAGIAVLGAFIVNKRHNSQVPYAVQD